MHLTYLQFLGMIINIKSELSTQKTAGGKLKSRCSDKYKEN